VNVIYLDLPVADENVEVGKRDQLIREDLSANQTGHEASVLDLNAHDSRQRPEQKWAHHLHNAKSIYHTL